MFTRITTFGDGGIFYNCSNLTEIDCYNIRRIQNSASITSTVFAGTKLSKVYYPNLIRAQQWAFATGTDSTLVNPEIVVIGASFTTIDNAGIFQYVARKKMFIYAKIVPAFSGTLGSSGTSGTEYYVPDDSYDDYYASSAWSNLKSKLRKLSTYTGEKPWEILYPEELGLV